MTSIARRAAAVSLPALVAVLALAASSAASQAQSRRGPPPVLPGASARAPVEIDAENLQWRDAERVAVYSGKVVVTQGETTLHASRMRIQLGKADAAAAAAPATAQDQMAGVLPGAPAVSDIRRIEADGPVTIIQKDQIGAGDRGEYDKTADRVVLAGHVVLTQGQNATSGARLVYRIGRRDVTVEGGRGRVRSHFVPGDKPQAQPQGRPQPAAPADGADAFPGAGSSREPIQIEANRLDWSDAARRAVYSGAVTAVQGEAGLRAARLTIFVDPAQADAPRGAPAGGGRIRRIEADGGVTVMQKDQVITGSRAVYDRAANRIDMYGRVLATQGANVTRGSHLVYDLATKRATMVSGASGRAQGVFTPGENDAAPAAPARPARRAAR